VGVDEVILTAVTGSGMGDGEDRLGDDRFAVDAETI
jgi:hypothetical protein